MPSRYGDEEIPVVTFGPIGPRFRCRCVVTPSRLAVVQSLRCLTNSCEILGEYAVFARAWEREREREPEEELPEGFEAHCRLVEGLQKDDAGQLCTNQEVRARKVKELAGPRTKCAAEPDPASRWIIVCGREFSQRTVYVQSTYSLHYSLH